MPDQIFEGDIYALSKAISMAENRKPGYLDMMHKVHQGIKDNHTPVIGITGSPGAGKSTCINALIKQFAEKGKRVAVVAVDPSSSFTGGALLGDRIRMEEGWDMSQIFFRSIASRGDLGGLSRSVIDVTSLYKAAGFDIIIVESVGVGQNEIEISDVADHVFLIMVEGMGDEIQFLKAGIMEIADYFVLNKIDINPPGRTIRQLLQSDFLKSEDHLFKVDSLGGKNIPALAERMMGLSDERSRARAPGRELHVAVKLILESFHDRLSEPSSEERIEQMLGRDSSPYLVVKTFMDRIENLWEEV